MIAALDRLRPRRVLILCPRSVIGVWPGEFKKHLGADHGFEICAPTAGSVAKRLAKWREAAGDGPSVLVLNHEAAWRMPMADALLKESWDVVVVDESHRHASAGRSKFYSWAWRLKAAKRICLSGTPMSHSPLTIWPAMKFLAPNVLPSTYTQMKARHCVMGGYRVNGRPVQVMGYQHLGELEAKIAPYMDRVRKSDVLDLPPTVHQTVEVELPPAAMGLYRELEKEMIGMVEAGVVTASNALSKMMKLRQVVQGFVQTEDGLMVRLHDAKGAALAEYLDDLPETEPVVVFATFHKDLDAIHAAAAKSGRKSVELSGRRNEVGAVWKPDGGAVAAIQIQAGGVGINLTASAYCVFFAHDWSLGNYDQALARQDRPGQMRSVTYTHLVAAGTVDETIRKAIESRRDLVEAVLERIRGLSISTPAMVGKKQRDNYEQDTSASPARDLEWVRRRTPDP